MDIVNTVMTVTGYIWWGIIGVGLVVFIAFELMEYLKKVFVGRSDTEKTFYYEHDYEAPVAKVIRDEDYETKDGVNFYAKNVSPLGKPRDDFFG